MRILNVRFKNLNSLIGEWDIDFTQPAFVNSGIFAITGPTGAGKTTILDAICLALYGRTPRLNRINKSSNEIMSRQTGECFAEVTFQTGAGRFRCHWSQHRARNKPDGELQNPRHEIVEADSGQVLENKLREVADAIERITGMDFDRFTRSMLLAQGGFAAFLQAAPDERAPILEQITGTGIYSLISIKVHEMQVESSRQLKELQNQLGSMRFLSEEEEAGLKTQLHTCLKEESELAGEVEKLRQAKTWLEGIAQLEKELQELEQQWLSYEARRQAFEPQLQRLKRAERAAALEAQYIKLLNIREQQHQDAARQEQALKEHKAGQEALHAAAALQKQAMEKWERARMAQEEGGRVIKQVRELDVRLREIGSRMKIAQGALKEGWNEYIELGRQKDQAEQALQASEAALLEAEQYLAQHQADADLVFKLAGIHRLFEVLKSRQESFSNIAKAKAESAAAKDAAARTFVAVETGKEKARTTLTQAETRLQDLNTEMSRLLGGEELGDWHHKLAELKERRQLLERSIILLEQIDNIATDQDKLKAKRHNLTIKCGNLDKDIEDCAAYIKQCEREADHLTTEFELLKRIRSLEEERLHLVEGAPCPLCGSTQHPYASGVPVMDETELKLNQVQAELTRANQRLSDFKIDLAQTGKDLEQNQRDLEQKSKERQKLMLECEKNFNQLHLVMTAEPLSQLQSELQNTTRETGEIQALITKAEALARELKAAAQSHTQSRDAYDAFQQSWQEAWHELELAKQEQQRLLKEYSSLKEQLHFTRQEVQSELAAYYDEKAGWPDLDQILAELTARKNKWQQKEMESRQCKERIAALKADLDKHKILTQKLNEELKQRQAEYDKLAEDYQQLTKERQALFGVKQPDEEEERLKKVTDEAAAQLNQARAAYTGAEQHLAHLAKTMAALKQSMEERGLILQEAETQMLVSFRTAGFLDEADYCASCLSEDELKSLKDEAQSLKEENTRLQTLKQDKKRLLVIEQEKRVTELSGDVLQEQINRGQASLKESREQIGGITKTLEDNRTLRTQQQELLQKIKVQKAEAARWSDLHSLIGSADGKKYRNFAQGLTFEIMVMHANRQMQKLTDRYLLTRDELQPLELNVIDNYQAGQIRSTRNLSGGESFIVSLALALGLSSMASRSVPVDSLFLDEGFGTLDEDALDTALDTLAELNQEGKLIGIISHIAAVKERIATQIQVIPRPGGHSIIA
jgi:exonuclease SbcC